MSRNPFENPKKRLERLARISAYNPARVLEELHVMGGTLEVLPCGFLKLTGTGHASSIWHEAFSVHRAGVLELSEAGGVHHGKLES
jgi:hypothetical protein